MPRKFEDALDVAVLAPAAVQRVEQDIGLLRLDRLEQGRQVAGRRRWSRPRSRPPSRPPRNWRRCSAKPRAPPTDRPSGPRRASCLLSVLDPRFRPPARPMRLISQTSSTPLRSRTRRRTSSPSASMSAAVALPVLMRKLQCFSDTMAPPLRRPRQPASSISFQALCPVGLTKVLPPVRARIGWLSSRLVWMSWMRAWIAFGSSGAAFEGAADEDPVLRHAAVAIGEADLGLGQAMQRALAIERIGMREHLRHVAAIGAGIHAQRAADGAGNAGQEFEPADAGIARRQRDVEVERAGAGFDRAAGGADLGEAAAEADDDAFDAAVAHQQVGADADHRHRHVAGLRASGTARGRRRPPA